MGDWLVPFEVPGGSAAQFKFGVQLCEDIWCQDYEHQRESLDTLQIYHASGAGCGGEPLVFALDLAEER